MHPPVDRIGLERRKRVLRLLFEKYRRLRDEGRTEEASEHLRMTTLYAKVSLEETLALAQSILKKLEELERSSPSRATRRSAAPSRDRRRENP